jgi:hypothetical protein
MSETPIQQLERLIGALSVLVDQEHALLAGQAWDDAAALEDRIQSVIAGIAPLALDLGAEGLLPPDFKARIAAITQSHQTALDRLAAMLTQTKLELRNLDATEQRLTQMRPAYKTHQAHHPRPSFSAQC